MIFFVGQKRLWLVILLIFVAKPNFALGCPKEVEGVFEVISKVRGLTSPWKNARASNLRLGLKDGTATNPILFLFGYSEKELRSAGVEVSACAGLPKLFAVQKPALILSATLGKRVVRKSDGSQSVIEIEETGGQSFYPKDWDKDFPDGSRLRLVDNSKLPLYVIDFATWKSIDLDVVKEHTENAAAVAALILHEYFHAIQAHLFSRAGIEKDWKDCLSHKPWRNAVDEELIDWAPFFKAPHATIGPRELATIKRVLQRRALGSIDAKSRECWGRLESKETQEGTANYFGDRSVEQAGFRNPLTSMMLWQNPELTTQNPEIFAEGAEFFYMTGLSLSRALEQLDTNKAYVWQKNIERGSVLASELRSALSR